MKAISRLFCALCFVGAFLFTGCSGKLGYSVLLWNNPELGVSDGTILTVYIKSNISQVYVASLPDSKEKFELPLWQITEPESKGKALKQQQRFKDFEHTYASVKLDGLPIRADAVNTAKQVYRLRQGEIIRCLYRGKGAAVTNGNGNMSGEWLRVLTSTGTIGWCFSHNLELFQAENEVVFNGSASAETSENTGSTLEEVFKAANDRKWYPESFSEMIKTQRIHVQKMDPSYGFDFGLNVDEEGNVSLNGTAKIAGEDGVKTWTYTGITKKAEREYEFTGTSLQATFRGQNTLVIQYMEKGKVKVETFVATGVNIEEIVQKELYRRQDELKKIASAGPVFRSSNYGTIEFNNENSVTWKDYKLLVPSVISESALGSVTVTIEYFISNSLKSSYDGVITMHFVGMENGINFLYKLTDTGLRLEDATKAPVKEGIITARSASPMVLFFEKN
ncbi:MAG: SH3 domain-containing protein [Treponema sp.]|nr:SH3 domain-containing protein [Candidatus Treponema equifaecale]